MGKLLKEMLEKEGRKRLVAKIAKGTTLREKEVVELVDEIPVEKLEFAEAIYAGHGIEQLQRYIKYVFRGEK